MANITDRRIVNSPSPGGGLEEDSKVILPTEYILFKNLFNNTSLGIIEFWNSNNLGMFGKINFNDPNVYVRELSEVELVDTPNEVSLVDITGDIGIKNNTASNITLEFRRII
jgi:hypothetical protein